MSLFDYLKKRVIKEVLSWDGSASNYTTAETFAKASLINFNTGSTDDWTKGLVKLPVRNESDSKNVYIKQAVQAAAGGRGITRVTRPSNVSSEVFASKLKSAANEIIKAYKQWGGIAPDSVFKMAGREAPKERSIAFNKIYDDTFRLVQLADEAEQRLTMLYDIYFDETVERFYALGSRDGIVYRIEIFPDNNEVSIGEFIELKARDLFPKKNENSVKVYRGANNEMRWLSIASVAVLNRVGEIDSRELFDSFIRYADENNYFPVLNVYHLDEDEASGSEIGKADFLARHGYVYMASGTFHNDEFGRAFFEALRGRDDWGNSIEFYSPTARIENFNINGNAIQVPVYKEGINTGITLLREKHAASVFTLHKSKGGIG